MMDDSTVSKCDPILITGAGGFVGAKVTASLLSKGFTNLRCFVRPSTNLKRLESMLDENTRSCIRIIKGNLLVRDDCAKAADGISLVYHLAAGRGKSFSGCFLDSAVATRNLLDAVSGNQSFKRFVNVSSFAVYTNWNIPPGGLLDENCQIDREYMVRFDAYAFGKIKQDDLVIQYGKDRGIPYAILRPGIVFGPGRGGQITGRSGTDTFGFFIKIRGKNQIPLTYIDNCADAIVLAGLVKGVDYEVFNIVDDDLPQSNKLLGLLRKKVKPFFSIPVPYHVFYLFCYFWEKYSKWSKGQLPPAFNRRSCSAYFKGNTFSNEKLKRLLNWKPEISMHDALENYFVYLRNKEENKS